LFPNAFLNFKKQESKNETKKSQHVANPETPIYNYIQNMTKYILSFVKLLHSTVLGIIKS